MPQSSRQSPRSAEKVRARKQRREDRVQRIVAEFDNLPDGALVDVQVVAAMRSRSVASTWRDVANGYLPPPIKISPQATRWRVADLRKANPGGQK